MTHKRKSLHFILTTHLLNTSVTFDIGFQNLAHLYISKNYFVTHFWQYIFAEVKRLTDQYLQKVDADGGGVLWSCTKCGKQGKMKHHVRSVLMSNIFCFVNIFYFREHIESNHIDCLTFNCPFCNKEIKNRVALRSHISKNHREENLRSKGHVFW